LINVDWQGISGTSGQTTYDPGQTGVAVLPGNASDHWNVWQLAASYNPVMDSTGTSTGMTVTQTAPNNGAYKNSLGTAMDAGTTYLMGDYQALYGLPSVSAVTYTFSGLVPTTAFQIVCFGADDDSTHGGTVFTLATANGGATASTSGVDRKISSGAGVAYVSLNGTADANGYLTLTANVNKSTATWAGINGFQLQATVVPEPGTLALLATGLVGLLCYAWRKRR